MPFLPLKINMSENTIRGDHNSSQDVLTFKQILVHVIHRNIDLMVKKLLQWLIIILYVQKIMIKINQNNITDSKGKTLKFTKSSKYTFNY